MKIKAHLIWFAAGLILTSCGKSPGFGNAASSQNSNNITIQALAAAPSFSVGATSLSAAQASPGQSVNVNMQLGVGQTLNDGIILLTLIDGSTYYQAPQIIQNLVAGQSVNVSGAIALPADAPLGSYTASVTVFTANYGQRVYDGSSATKLTVAAAAPSPAPNPSPSAASNCGVPSSATGSGAILTSGCESPTQASVGQNVTVTGTLLPSESASNALVVLMVTDPDGNYYQADLPESLVSGTSIPLSGTIALPSTAIAGTYTANMNVWNGSTLIYQAFNFASFTVGVSSGSSPAPNPSPSAASNCGVPSSATGSGAILTSGCESPTQASVGQNVTVTGTLLPSESASNALVVLMVTDPDGNYYQADLPESLVSGTSIPLSGTIALPSTAIAGTYTANMNVWNGSTLIYQAFNFASFTVGVSSGSSPAPNPSPSAASTTGSNSSSSGSTSTAAARQFPQVGIQAIYGNQYFPTTNLNGLAQYSWILMGGNYPSWPAQNGANGGYNTRDQVIWGPSGVGGLKNQTHTGKNAVTPVVIQYQDGNDIPNANPYFPEWTTVVASNNWYVYESGSSGTKTPNPNGDTSWYLLNWGHVVGTDPSTGLYPGALLGLYDYRLFDLGTSSEGSAMASTHLDGLYEDDDQVDLVPNGGTGSCGGPADWGRTGCPTSTQDSTDIGAQTTGKADFPVEINSLNSSLLVVGNTPIGSAQASTACGGLGITTNNLAGYYDELETQYMFGSSGSPAAGGTLSWGGFTCFMNWYQLSDAALKTGGQSILSGQINTTDYVTLRYSLTATLMRNGIFVVGNNNGAPQDLVDPGNSATFPQFDEFWGGSLNTAGYLGTPSSTSQGAVQTSAWQNGVWRRDFVNGIVLVNPANNGTQTVNLGGTFYFLHGTQVPSVNTGQATTIVTLPPGDGRILLRVSPP